MARVTHQPFKELWEVYTLQHVPHESTGKEDEKLNRVIILQTDVMLYEVWN
jgi:hypothetical protein